MNSQEQESLQETQTESTNFGSEVIKYLAMLHLNNSSAAASTTSAAATTLFPATQSPVSSITRRLSKKRASPSSSSILRKKLLSKKPALSPPSPTTVHHHSTAVETPSPPPLHRSLSEPINYSPVVPTAETPNGGFLKDSLATHSLSPENFKNSDSSAKSASKPPLPPPLRRTSSAPVPSDYQLLMGPTVTPPRHPAVARTMVSSPISDNEESTSSKRLKRMKERMQEMTDWCQQVLSEGDEQPTTDSEVGCKKDDEADNGTEECVWVDENPGGSLTIHFKCPCGKAYEVLLSGNNCYYKLM